MFDFIILKVFVIPTLLAYGDSTITMSQEKGKCKTVLVEFHKTVGDLKISAEMTEIVFQPAPGKIYNEPVIIQKGQSLQAIY